MSKAKNKSTVVETEDNAKTFMGHVLDRTQLDEQIIEGYAAAEAFLKKKQSNVQFVAKNFPYATGALIAIGCVTGVIIGFLI